MPLSGDEDTDSADVNKKSNRKCEFCNTNFRSSVKCIKCNLNVHAKCFELMAKLCEINKNNWICKECLQDETADIIECAHQEVSPSMNVYSQSKTMDRQQQNRELQLLQNLNSELKTVNNLLKLRLSEIDNKCKNILNPKQFSTDVNKICEPSTSTSVTHDELPTMPTTYRDVFAKNLKTDSSMVLVLEPKNKSTNFSLNEFKNKVKPGELGPGITKVKETNNGKVILNCVNEDYLTKIKSNLEKCVGKSCKVLVPNKLLPRIKIKNINNLNNLNNEELCEHISKLNEFSAEDHFRIVKKIELSKKFDIIAEMSASLFKKVMSVGYVFVGWQKSHVTESFNVTRCFKCSRFGHLANTCKSSKYICPICGSDHKLEDCNNKGNLNCVNCVNHNTRFKTNIETNHSARNVHCPIYIRQVEVLKSRTNYEI